MAAATSAQLRFLTDAAHLMRQTAPRTSAYLMSRRIDLASTSQAAALVSGTLPTATLPQTDIQRQHVCTSCGLILIPGRDGTTLRMQSGFQTLKNKKANESQGERIGNRKRKRDEKTDARVMETTVSAEVKIPYAPVARLGVTKVFVCGLCSRETRIVLPPPPPLSKQRKHKAAAEVRLSDEGFAFVPGESKSAAKSPTVQPTALPLSADSTRPSTTPAKAMNNANSKKRAKNRKAGLLALLNESRATEKNGMNSSFSFDDFRKK